MEIRSVFFGNQDATSPGNSEIAGASASTSRTLLILRIPGYSIGELQDHPG